MLPHMGDKRAGALGGMGGLASRDRNVHCTLKQKYDSNNLINIILVYKSMTKHRS